MLSLDSPVEAIPGGPKRLVPKLHDLKIRTVRDLLYHFPSRYTDFSSVKKISELTENETATIRGEVVGIRNRRAWRRSMTVTEALIRDQTGSIRAVWFNQPYIVRNVTPGTNISVAGKVLWEKGGLTFSNPNYEIVRPETATTHTGKIIAIYPETKGLTSKGIRHFIKQALGNLGPIADPVPDAIRRREGLPEITLALRWTHAPERLTDAETARNRFAFEELLYLQIFNLRERAESAKRKAPEVRVEIPGIKKVLATLPFTLTQSQKRALWEIVRDMAKPVPMNRLLQGDVGSGKTVVLALAALFTAEDGKQAALMAPTEILARQHYRTFIKLFPAADQGIALLTAAEARIYHGAGAEQKIGKSEIRKEIERGAIKIVIGTHTLIQKGVKFKDLALVTVDEQHRFGIRQRAELLQRGSESRGASEPAKLAPHFLSMSATPIPRTLALTVFGDLDLTLINELPQNRKPILTKIVDPENRLKAYQFIRAQVRQGRQVFVICPHIEAPEAGDGAQTSNYRFRNLDVKNVKEEYGKLSGAVFPDLKVAMLHGKMKPAEKEKVMRDFSDGRSDILVSTSVVEVGVDVPNATIMLIESAERFGLAQLYQFRGRVGRGEHQSYCLLFTEKRARQTRERLQSVERARSGFELAEIDLKIRGPGEFLGVSQTGMPDIAMRALQNPALVKTARDAAAEIVREDPELARYAALRAAVSKFRRQIHRE